jgi:hypothetical protein
MQEVGQSYFVHQQIESVGGDSYSTRSWSVGFYRNSNMDSSRFSRRMTWSLWVFLIICFQTTPRAASSAAVAVDTGSNSAYAAEVGGAWKGLNSSAEENPTGMDNGGIGFAPWNFAGGYHASQFSPYGRLNHVIDGVDFPTSSFNNLGAPAFGLTNANQANLGYTSRATRVFNTPLTAGDVLSIDFDNPIPAPLANNDSAGFLIRLNSGSGPRIESYPNVAERFGMFVTSGFNNDNWSSADLAGVGNTGVNAAATTSGTTLSFMLTADESYSMKLIRRSDGQTLFARAGQLSNPNAGPIDTIEISLFGNGSGNGLTGSSGLPTGQREFFFNNLRIEGLLTGDLNQNGIVDAADYVIWRKGLNTLYTQQHYEIWRARFGQTAAQGAAIPDLSGVTLPEPTSPISLLIAMLALIFANGRLARNRCRRRGTCLQMG